MSLDEYSPAYRADAAAYLAFSEAEDAPGHITQALIPLITAKDVLDVGCGAGKYLQKLAPYAKSMMGTDQSVQQLEQAARCTPTASLVLADAAHLPFEPQFDVVLASWMLGTIDDPERQRQVLDEMHRVLRPRGVVVLVENDAGSEFEQLRGRFPDSMNRTETYNRWLHRQGFRIHQRINTYFQFTDAQRAQQVFLAQIGRASCRERV